jgi:uncharacterized protein (DUF488 family)
MILLTTEDFNTRDIYFFYDYEEAYMRYEYKTKRFFLKLVNGGPEYERPYDTKLVCDIEIFGIEVTEADYKAGIPIST